MNPSPFASGFLKTRYTSCTPDVGWSTVRNCDGGAFGTVVGRIASVSPSRAPGAESRCTSIFPPVAWYCAGATAANVTAATSVRSTCLNSTDEGDLLTTVICTGSSGTLCFDTPSDNSPLATTKVGERRTTVFSFEIAGIPLAPRSVYSARSISAPPGTAPNAAVGAYAPRTGSDGVAVF